MITERAHVNEREVISLDEIQSQLPVLIASASDVDPALIPLYLEALKHEKIVKFGDQAVINTFFPPFPSRAFERVFNRGLNYPMVTSIATTNACHGQCSYCSYGQNGERDMSLEQISHIISQLQSLGVPVIAFTGGESLLRNDLEQIIASVDDRSSTILYTSGYSNGKVLSLDRARRLKESGLFALSVSLDHYDRETNDKGRFPGAYDCSLQAIRNSLEAGLYTVSSIVVTEENFDGLEEYINFMNGVGVHGIRILDIVPSGVCIDQPPLSPEKRKKIIEIHKKVNADPSLPQLTTFSHVEGEDMFGCGAGGVHHMFVDGEGNLRPCDFIPIVFGNLIRESLEDVYTKMREVFSYPRPVCLMKACHGAVAKALGGRRTVDADGVEALLGQIRKRCKLPKLYAHSKDV